jgi:3-methylcrotonyl-CoA carboxylase alpha subunit
MEFDGAAECEISRLADRLIVRTPSGSHSAVAVRQGDAVLVSYGGRQYRIEKAGATRNSRSGPGSGDLKAPMPGVVVDVFVAEGTAVAQGDKILVLEAMKVQQPYTAPFDGVLTKLTVAKGQQVTEGMLLAVVEPHSLQGVEGDA